MPVPITALRCPESGSELALRGDGFLVAVDGDRVYGVVGGAPILIAPDNPLFDHQLARQRRDATSPLTRARSALSSLVPSPTLAIGTERRYEKFAELARQLAHGRASVLVVGGGRLGHGMEALVTARDIDLTETDVYLSDRVDVVCDAHQLPFADGTFDGVVIQAVLEHVLSPERVVAEIHRVLKPLGVVYAETPFMQQVHEGPYDFTRFTDLGHRRLFRAFSELDRGAVCGPATSLVWAIRYFARALPRKSARIAALLDLAATVAFSWLKHADRVLVNHATARDGASGVYFLGLRQDQAVDDAELLRTYTGGLSSPFVSGREARE